MGTNTITTDRNQYVVKANSIIRTRYKLTLQQQRIVLFCISKIKPSDDIGQEYTFSIGELCAACGLKNDDGGTYYREIKRDLLKLCERRYGITPDGALKTISWIGDVEITPYSGTVSIQFNKNMAPFLFELKNNYTQYKLENALMFKSKYSLHLYEILRSHTTQKALDHNVDKLVEYKVDELREMLDCVEDYKKWAEFDRNVIRKAINEINACCDDIHIEYTTAKKGRSIDRINFIISSPKPIEYISALGERRKRLL